ncbi:hypothetical protein ACN267_32145 [Micromonospora sp. WMMD734]|uniref:hypothetical protein n=1 Tax=Micromonospora sp. WMMD734 TaxID=3404129 RepID=UPI003B955D9B
MRRRDLLAAHQAAPAEVPEHLRSMRGVSTFLPQVAAEPVPVWVPPAEVSMWRSVGAFRLWLQARREWCRVNGRDYAATFRPVGGGR